MSSTDNRDDVFVAPSQFLSPSSTGSLQKSPSRQTINSRRSNTSLRGTSSIAHAMDDDASNGRFSLAHELAVALMPEPSAGSKLLAEEFGIEYDEGAEGIDEDVEIQHESGPHIIVDDTLDSTSFANSSDARDSPFHDTSEYEPPLYDQDPVFGSPSMNRQRKSQQSEQDAMDVLAQNLESTDKFLSHLRRLDADASTSTSKPHLETIASDVIRRINESTRDREGQVRELLECEREFRKIAGELGGGDVLGQLDELAHFDIIDEDPAMNQPQVRQLEIVEEEHSQVHDSHDWEEDHRQLGDEDDDLNSDFGADMSLLKDSFPVPPPISGPPTPAVTLPQLAHLRSFTTSLITSLTTISEQAQVNGVGTTDAGRKIRALKNKMGSWRTDWDSAERSRARIERWEAGITDGSDTPDGHSPLTTGGTKRIDGRSVVKEHLQAFEKALADAAIKTQAIMAS